MMISYIKGFFKNLGGKSSPLAQITVNSRVSRLARVGPFAKVYKSEIDRYSYIGPKTWVVNAKIGKFCSIANKCNIGLGNHTTNNISTSPIYTEKRNGTGSSWINKNTNNAITEPTKIGNDVWIGTNVIVKSGVKIGNGAIIGAGAIVTKDVPAYAIVVGVPAKIVRYRFDKTIVEILLKSEWWDKSHNFLKENIEIFQKENPTIDDLKMLL